MRARTRNVILGTVGVLVLLVGIVVVLTSIGTGDPYYLTAEHVDGVTEQGASTANESSGAVNGTTLPDRRFPYVTEAIAQAGEPGGAPGRSGPYRTGPIGLKEVFSHSPFDELDALRQRNPNATVGEDVLLRRANATYRIGVVREASGQ
ncbi:MAG: hypothetical protein V5A43_05730 [Haloarculaceae archaeon]